MPDIKSILLDIEGTTTSISFVKDVLFPYARENLRSFLEDHWESEELVEDIRLLSEQATEDSKNGFSDVPLIDTTSPRTELVEQVVANVAWQMGRDRKTTALKQLQGHIWRDGYHTGKLKGHVYEDVGEAFKRWTSSGKKLYIYSSGSVEAQKLLFGHSVNGDLLPYLSGHFDTTVGAKQEAKSYSAILASIGILASQILFLTDIPGEAKAARDSGLEVAIMLRPGNAAIPEDVLGTYQSYVTFAEVK